MIKRRAIWIFSYLTFAFLPARAQEHGNAWNSAMNTGLEALQNHDCAKAEQAFQEVVTLAAPLKQGKNDAMFSTAFILAAQACGAQGKRDQADAEMLARRAADGMDQALRAYHPEGNIHLFVNSQRAAVLFDQVGDIFAAYQKPLEAERSYQRVIKLLNTGVQANEAAQQEGDRELQATDRETDLPSGYLRHRNHELFMSSVLLAFADPRGKTFGIRGKIGPPLFWRA